MTLIDLDALIAALDPDNRGGRHHIDQVAAAIRAMVTYVDAAAVPQLVLDTIRRGEQAGRWSATRTTTVRRGRTTLPKSVMLPRAGPPGDKLRLVGVPLRQELAPWATTLPLSSSQRDLLLAVNDWLKRTNGGNVPIIAAAERAYELVRDEKAFDSSPPRGGTTLWRPDRLTFGMLRCERIPTPLTWEPVTPAVDTPGPVLCVENHATFRTVLRALRGQQSPPWVAVAWVQGRNTAPLESLAKLPFPVTRLDYLGDLDPAGLEIAATACATAEVTGVPAGPAGKLWEILVQLPPRQGRKIDNTRARQLAAWLPEPVQQPAAALLTKGQAIPQEALRYDILAPALT
jgi:hypothetical protein